MHKLSLTIEVPKIYKHSNSCRCKHKVNKRHRIGWRALTTGCTVHKTPTEVQKPSCKADPCFSHDPKLPVKQIYLTLSFRCSCLDQLPGRYIRGNSYRRRRASRRNCRWGCSIGCLCLQFWAASLVVACLAAITTSHHLYKCGREAKDLDLSSSQNARKAPKLCRCKPFHQAALMSLSSDSEFGQVPVLTFRAKAIFLRRVPQLPRLPNTGSRRAC